MNNWQPRIGDERTREMSDRKLETYARLAHEVDNLNAVMSYVSAGTLNAPAHATMPKDRLQHILRLLPRTFLDGVAIALTQAAQDYADAVRAHADAVDVEFDLSQFGVYRSGRIYGDGNG